MPVRSYSSEEVLAFAKAVSSMEALNEMLGLHFASLLSPEAAKEVSWSYDGERVLCCSPFCPPVFRSLHELLLFAHRVAVSQPRLAEVCLAAHSRLSSLAEAELNSTGNPKSIEARAAGKPRK